MALYNNTFTKYWDFLFTDLAGWFSIILYFKKFYKFLIDPRTNDWPMISSPLPGLTIIAAYLYFVNSWGPKYMANRKPFKMQNLLVVYNFFQVLISCYLFYEVSTLYLKFVHYKKYLIIYSIGFGCILAAALQLEMSTS